MTEDEHNKPCILVVDDEKENLTSFKYVFEEFYEIFLAESAKAGYKIMQKHDIQVVISDQRMPVETGVEFLEKISKNYPDTVRMILTGYSDISTVIDAINKGKIYYYLSKPWDENEMKLLIDNALEVIALKKEIIQNEKRFKSLTEMLPEAIFESDQNSTIVYFNKKACSLFGYSKEEFCQDFSIFSLFVEKERDEIKRYLEDRLKNLAHSDEFTAIRKDGSTFPILFRTSIILNEAVLSGFRIVIVDIAERKQAEVELLKSHSELEKRIEEKTIDYKLAKEEAEQANQLKSEFLANISHELRNPMHQILSYSKYGIDRINRPKEKLLHYFIQTRKSAKRLMVLLDDLLNLSKMESGKIDYNMQINNIHQMIKEIVTELSPSLEEKSLSIEVEDPSVPTEIRCDFYKIGQVIRNLLSNAIKFSLESKPIEIEFDLYQQKNEGSIMPLLKVSIHDQGIGIPEDEITSVFEKFVQSTRTKTGAGGTGLGLAISKEIIKAHGGIIWAENRSDGATFNLILPYENRPIEYLPP